jgi:hypothetical protein
MCRHTPRKQSTFQNRKLSASFGGVAANSLVTARGSCSSSKFHPAEKLDRSPDVLTVKARLDGPIRGSWKTMKIKAGEILAKERRAQRSLALVAGFMAMPRLGGLHHRYHLPPEFAVRSILKENKADRQGKCASRRRTLLSVAFRWVLQSPNGSFAFETNFENYHRDRPSGSCCARLPERLKVYAEMQEWNVRRIRGMLTVALLLCAGILSNAQSKDAGQGLPDSPTPAERSIEDLNYLGGDAAMPPFSDSVIDVNSGISPGTLEQGHCLSSHYGAGVYAEHA